MRVSPAVVFGLLTVSAFAGCLMPAEEQQDEREGAKGAVKVRAPSIVERIQAVTNSMTFTKSIVAPAIGVAADLYEPTMEVSDKGTLYVAAHVIGAATTGTPAYYSSDDGKTWKVLPFAGPAAVPPPVQGSTPPPGDEGFIVYGDNGQAWMADIYLAGFSVNGWCNNGASMCYDNRNAYDRSAIVTSSCRPLTSLNDRPWAAYGGGNLLLVNNPGGGAMQIGMMKVPPVTPVGSFDPVTGPKWNLCASPGGGIPGIPAMRKDGFFAVPQMWQGKLNVVTGNAADIFKVKHQAVFPVTSSAGGTSNGGRTAFGLDGTLFVGAYNNTKADSAGIRQGQFVIAASTDDGETWVNKTFITEKPVRSFYLDGNMAGPGALVVWSNLGTSEARSDWFVAHLSVGAAGEPVLSEISLAVDEGPHSSAHVMGAAAGPDGRAYFVNFQGGSPYQGSTPISVWIQNSGPTLPVLGAAELPTT